MKRQWSRWKATTEIWPRACPRCGGFLWRPAPELAARLTAVVLCPGPDCTPRKEGA